MTTIPLTEQQIADDMVILNFQNVGLSDEQFIELCADNRDFHLELTAQKELLIMTPPGPRTGRRNETITTSLGIWARQDGRGVAFGALTLFHLPNGAKRAPDAAWLRREKWGALTEEQQEMVAPLCPDFVVELMSPSDRRPYRFRMVQAKMEEYLANGAQLGWLIDPFEKKVYVYRPGKPVECFSDPETMSGDPVLPGFVLRMAEVWP
jgi:Uma2 family endonuclease